MSCNCTTEYVPVIVGEEDLVCCHLNMNPIEESDDKDLSKLDEISCDPKVEIVEEEYTSKFVYNNSEELFPTKRVHINTPTINDMQSDMDNIELMFNDQHEHSNPMFHKEVDDEDFDDKSRHF